MKNNGQFSNFYENQLNVEFMN